VVVPNQVLRLTRRTDSFSVNTLKANFSPGLALKPWVHECLKRFFATLKELRRICGGKRRRNSFRVASSKNCDAFSQGCQSATLGLELANAFSVIEAVGNGFRYLEADLALGELVITV
jgi:hypothetical protein